VGESFTITIRVGVTPSPVLSVGVKEAIEYMNISLKKFDFFEAQSEFRVQRGRIVSQKQTTGTHLLLFQGHLLLFKLADAIVQLREPSAGEHNNIGTAASRSPYTRPANA
jgi:hypothetical protein